MTEVVLDIDHAGVGKFCHGTWLDLQNLPALDFEGLHEVTFDLVVLRLLWLAKSRGVRGPAVLEQRCVLEVPWLRGWGDVLKILFDTTLAFTILTLGHRVFLVQMRRGTKKRKVGFERWA